MEMEPTAKYSIITKKLGAAFSTLELLGLFYQIDGFYLDAKKCYEIQHRLLRETLQKIQELMSAAKKTSKEISERNDWLREQYHPYLQHIETMIEDIQDRIEMSEATEPGMEKKKGWWFTGWTGDLADYAKKVRKDQHQDDDTVSEKKETESSQHYDRKQTWFEIQTFEKDVLRPAARKLFHTEIELNDKLKELPWRIGFTSRGTLFEKTKLRRKQSENKILEPDDPKNVGLLRYLDIGDLVEIIKDKLGTTFKQEINYDLKAIIKHRNKLDHPQDFPENVFDPTNVIIVMMIRRIKPFFENFSNRR